jgi:hypothetical protein
MILSVLVGKLLNTKVLIIPVFLVVAHVPISATFFAYEEGLRRRNAFRKRDSIYVGRVCPDPTVISGSFVDNVIFVSSLLVFFYRGFED